MVATDALGPNRTKTRRNHYVDSMIQLSWYAIWVSCQSYWLIVASRLLIASAIYGQHTLDQAMACCLVAPRHCPNQCWLITNEVPWHSSDDNAKEILRYQLLRSISEEVLKISIRKMGLKTTIVRLLSHLSRISQGVIFHRLLDCLSKTYLNNTPSQFCTTGPRLTVNSPHKNSNAESMLSSR